MIVGGAHGKRMQHDKGVYRVYRVYRVYHVVRPHLHHGRLDPVALGLQAGRRVGRSVEVAVEDLDVRRQVVGHRVLALRVDVDLRRGAHVIGGLRALRRHVREVDLLVVGRPRVEGARHRRAESVAVQEVGREPALDVLLREEAEDLVAEGGVPAWHQVRGTGWRLWWRLMQRI